MPFLFSAQKQNNPKNEILRKQNLNKPEDYCSSHMSERWSSTLAWISEGRSDITEVNKYCKQVITFVSSHENNLLR